MNPYSFIIPLGIGFVALVIWLRWMIAVDVNEYDHEYDGYGE